MFRYIHGGELTIGTLICDQEAPVGAVMTFDLADPTKMASASGGDKVVYFLTQEVTTLGRSYIDKVHGIPNIVGIDGERKAWFAKKGDRATLQGGQGVILTSEVNTTMGSATEGDEVEVYYDSSAGYSKLQPLGTGQAIGKLVVKDVEGESGVYMIEVY